MGTLGTNPHSAGEIQRVAEPFMDGSIERFLGRVGAAFAVTRGPDHVITWANAAFHGFITLDKRTVIGRPITEMVSVPDGDTLRDILDHARGTGEVARHCRVGPLDGAYMPLHCSVWPEVLPSGDVGMVIVELRPPTQGELNVELQREVAERLLLTALREQEAAAVAEVLRRSAAFLAFESRRLSESLDEGKTLEAMAGMTLAHLGDWCIVDTLDARGNMLRLSIVHPDPALQDLLDRVNGRWAPLHGDPFGLPAVLAEPRTSICNDSINDALGGAADDPELSVALRTLGVRGMMTVPLVVRDRLLGAVTFVRSALEEPFTRNDIELAEDIASRAAMALDRARAYGEAVALKLRAEAAALAKSEFLGMMSHELRTPLNAIGGYIDLMDMELHGPVTDAQRVDLARIRTNQRYLMGLISDLLNFTKLGGGQLAYSTTDVPVYETLMSSVVLVAPLITQKGLERERIACDVTIIARADAEKVTQILVNLLSNAIKFTAPGGRIAIDCATDGDWVVLRVGDTGIGIPSDKLEVIFDPFIQVKGSLTGIDGGVGLGLAISRGLARGMGGDLTVESTLGEGARFTLRLPRSPADVRT